MTDDLGTIDGLTFYLCPSCSGRLSHPPDLIPCFSCMPTETLPDPNPTDDLWDFPVSLSFRQGLPTPEQEIRQKNWEELRQQFQESREWWQSRLSGAKLQHKTRKPPLAPIPPPHQTSKPIATKHSPGGIPL